MITLSYDTILAPKGLKNCLRKYKVDNVGHGATVFTPAIDGFHPPRFLVLGSRLHNQCKRRTSLRINSVEKWNRKTPLCCQYPEEVLIRAWAPASLSLRDFWGFNKNLSLGSWLECKWSKSGFWTWEKIPLPDTIPKWGCKRSSEGGGGESQGKVVMRRHGVSCGWGRSKGADLQGGKHQDWLEVLKGLPFKRGPFNKSLQMYLDGR